MFRQDFPVRVLKNYGWAHSLHFNTDEEIIRSYQNTPKDWPWFIHLAEGTDEVAADEYQHLKKLGCLGVNTIPIHCVGLSIEDVKDSRHMAGQYRGHGSQMPFVWCPTTNIFLLEKDRHPDLGWNTMPHLGSDSRLTAEGDLLDELRYVSQKSTVENAWMNIFLVTSVHYRWHYVLKDKVKHIREEHSVDFVLIGDVEKAAYTLCNSSRKDLPCVMFDSIPQIGNPDIMVKFPHVQTIACTLDGIEKLMNVELARQVHRCTLKEQGLEVDALPQGKRFIFF
jgi:hypothetical protein